MLRADDSLWGRTDNFVHQPRAYLKNVAELSTFCLTIASNSTFGGFECDRAAGQMLKQLKHSVLLAPFYHIEQQ